MNQIKTILLFLVFLSMSPANFASDTCPLIGDIQIQEQTDNLRISGTTTKECKKIEIQLYCNKEDGGSLIYTILPDSEEWEILVSYEKLKEIFCCKPNSTTYLYVGISCLNENNTQICAESIHTIINCGDGGECPVVTLQADAPDCSYRNADGTWPVRFNISSYPGQFTGSYNVVFGDGVVSNYPITIDTFTHQYECPHSEPPYSVTVIANGCETDPEYTSSSTITLDFPACECPVIEELVSQIDNCTVVLSANVSSCSESVIQYIWNFGEDTPDTTNTPTSNPHTYTHGGTYTVSVTLAGAGDNCSSSIQIDIPQCQDDGTPNTDDTPTDGTPTDDTPTDDTNDDASICGVFDWCCWFLALFLALYIAFWIMWNYNVTPYAWYVGIAALIVFILWIAICQPTYCGVLLVLFAAGIVALAICGVIALVPGAPNPTAVISSLAGSYPAAILSVITLVLVPILFAFGNCSGDCNDFVSCMKVLWERATTGR